MQKLAAAVVATILLLAGCGGSDDDEDAASSTTTTGASTTAAADRPLEILVTNDDGFAAPGIDAVVEALRKNPANRVTVVAPASNQSGTGDKTTAGALTVSDGATASGYRATAVAGFPADTVNYALDELHLTPHLVVSGTNIGQNIGPFAHISGTVGAAKMAARRGIPALAASTGIADTPDFARSAAYVVEWVDEHRAALLRKDVEPHVEALNTPTCPKGDRGLVETELADDFEGRDAGKVDCDSTKPEGEVTDDVDAFLNGFTSLTDVPK